MHTSRAWPVACLISSCALWGVITVFNKVLLAAIPAVPLLAIQLAVSTLALAAFVRLRRREWPAAPAILPLVLLGILNPGVSYTLALLGLALIPASTASLLWASEPLMIVALAAVVLREPMKPPLVAVLAAGLLGVALVTGAWQKALRSPVVGGTGLMILAILCCALYTVLARRIVQTTDPVASVAIQQGAGLGWCLVLLNLAPFGSFLDIVSLPVAQLALAMLSGLFYYAVAYGLFMSALRVTPAGIASGYYNLIPVSAVGLAYLLLGETLTATQWIGSTIILASAAVLAWITTAAEAKPYG
jgi:drug/metabolite transporter (DMT)-like permease